MQVFEYLLAHQSERQEQIDSSKTSPNAAAAKASRRAATAQSEKAKQSKTSSRKSSTSTQKQQPQGHGKGSFSDGETENSTTSSDTYGFAGIYMALFAGSGFLLHSARSKSQQFSDTASMKSRRDRAPLPKSIKYGPTGKKLDDNEKQSTNFLWTSLTACLGPAASSNLPPTVESLCNFLSRLILKILAFFGYILAFRSTARFNYSSVTNSQLTIPTFSYDDGFGGTATAPIWSNFQSNLSGSSANGRIAVTADLTSSNPIVDANSNVLQVRLLMSGAVSSFGVALESGTNGSATYVTTANGVTHNVDVGIAKIAGITVGTTGTLEIITDTGTLGTVGDNQLHMVSTYDATSNLTRLQVKYDTNASFGSTTASNVIAMDFLGDVTANLTPAHLTFI